MINSKHIQEMKSRIKFREDKKLVTALVSNNNDNATENNTTSDNLGIWNELKERIVLEFC